MLVVKIEMWPRGQEDRSFEIGRTYIWNKGGNDKRGDYNVAVKRKGDFERKDGYLPSKGAMRSGEVINYPRLSYNVWRLVLRALKSAFPEEKS